MPQTAPRRLRTSRKWYRRRVCASEKRCTGIFGARTGHRFYNFDTGRWLNRDPIEELAFVVHYNMGITEEEWESEDAVYLTVSNSGIEYGMVDNDPVGKSDWLGLALFVHPRKQCNVLTDKCTQRGWYKGQGGKRQTYCKARTCTYQCFCKGDRQCPNFPCKAHRRGVCIHAHGIHVGPIKVTWRDTPWWLLAIDLYGRKFAPSCHQSPARDKAYKDFKCHNDPPEPPEAFPPGFAP